MISNLLQSASQIQNGGQEVAVVTSCNMAIKVANRWSLAGILVPRVACRFNSMSETSLARTRERAAKPRVARPLARAFSRGSLRLPRRACSQANERGTTQTENRWMWLDNILYLNIHSLLQAFGSVSGEWGGGMESIFFLPTSWPHRSEHQEPGITRKCSFRLKMFSNTSFTGLISWQLQRSYSTSAKLKFKWYR